MEVAGSFDRIGRVAVADTIEINRAPVPTLWAAAATERLGFDHATALTLAQTLAVSAPMPKGVSLGISEPKPSLVREQGERIKVLAKATLIGAAQLGYFVSGGMTIVRASTDADAAPEVEIQLTGTKTLTEVDFRP